MEKTTLTTITPLRAYACNIQKHADEVFCSRRQRFFDFPLFSTQTPSSDTTPERILLFSFRSISRFKRRMTGFHQVTRRHIVCSSAKRSREKPETSVWCDESPLSADEPFAEPLAVRAQRTGRRARK